MQENVITVTAIISLQIFILKITDIKVLKQNITTAHLKFCSLATWEYQWTFSKYNIIYFAILNSIIVVNSRSDDLKVYSVLLTFWIYHQNFGSSPRPTCKCTNLKTYMQ